MLVPLNAFKDKRDVFSLKGSKRKSRLMAGRDVMTWEEFKESTKTIEEIDFQFNDETQTVSVILDDNVSPFVPYKHAISVLLAVHDCIEFAERIYGSDYPPGLYGLLKKLLFQGLAA